MLFIVTVIALLPLYGAISCLRSACRKKGDRDAIYNNTRPNASASAIGSASSGDTGKVHPFPPPNMINSRRIPVPPPEAIEPASPYNQKDADGAFVRIKTESNPIRLLPAGSINVERVELELNAIEERNLMTKTEQQKWLSVAAAVTPPLARTGQGNRGIAAQSAAAADQIGEVMEVFLDENKGGPPGTVRIMQAATAARRLSFTMEEFDRRSSLCRVAAAAAAVSSSSGGDDDGDAAAGGGGGSGGGDHVTAGDHDMYSGSNLLKANTGEDSDDHDDANDTVRGRHMHRSYAKDARPPSSVPSSSKWNLASIQESDINRGGGMQLHAVATPHAHDRCATATRIQTVETPQAAADLSPAKDGLSKAEHAKAQYDTQAGAALAAMRKQLAEVEAACAKAEASSAALSEKLAAAAAAESAGTAEIARLTAALQKQGRGATDAATAAAARAEDAQRPDAGDV